MRFASHVRVALVVSTCMVFAIACAPDAATAPHKTVVNPYADIGEMHNTLLDVGMRAARASTSTDADVLENTALDAAINFRRGRNMESGIRAGASLASAMIHPNLMRVSRDLLAPAGDAYNQGTITAEQYNWVVKLNNIIMDESLDIDQLDWALDDFDYNAENALGGELSAIVLPASAVARSSADYWYANTPPSGNMLNFTLALDCGWGTGRTCPVKWRHIAEIDFVGVGAGLLTASKACAVTGPGYLACLLEVGFTGAVGASVYQGVWDVFVGPGSSGGGSSGSAARCDYGEYATYSRGSIVCKKYTV